jgi:hypothetical protein
MLVVMGIAEFFSAWRQLGTVDDGAKPWAWPRGSPCLNQTGNLPPGRRVEVGFHQHLHGRLAAGINGKA